LSLQERFWKWFNFYLSVLSVSLAVILSGSLIFAVLTNRSFLDVLNFALLLGAIILIGVGIVSSLPLSEYSYGAPYGIGRAGTNPVILRDSIRHMKKRKKESRKRGILLGLVGLTLLLIYLVMSSKVPSFVIPLLAVVFQL